MANIEELAQFSVNYKRTADMCSSGDVILKGP